MRALSEAWSRFWHTQAESSTLTLFRAALGFVVLCWGMSLGFDLRAFYSGTGLLPAPEYTAYRISIFRWFTSDAAIAIAYLILLCSALAVAVGRGFRLAAVLMWLMVCSFQFDNTYVLNGGDVLIRVLCAYTALYALLAPRGSAGLPLSELFAPVRAPEFATAPVWLLRLVQIQLTLIYPFSIIDKFRGETWLDGTATTWALNLVEFQRLPLPDLMRESLLIGNVLTYGVLAVEFALPFLLWTRKTRRLGIGLGIGLHLALNYALRLGFFGWIMVAAYLAFLTPREAGKLLVGAREIVASVGQRLSPRKDVADRATT